ncbi:MAG TPA: TatD family hydrolase [Gemmatimonadaceae bacterium]|jgi:TatD DNase family protein|nr:TatD family hydrolase [Gemmatimonadaceae bacterium]
MLSYIDSHAHLADAAFDGVRDAVVARARAAGAAAVICIGESFAAAEQARALASAHPGFVAWTSGVHPHYAAAFREADAIPAIRAHLEAGAVAVGECGLDYHYDHAPRASQLAAFRAQLALAVAHDRPVIVHTRKAEDDTRALVEEFGRAGARGVMHCFTGSAALARAALDAGWFISFSGIVTFRSWDRDDVVRLVPDDRILVESDAPYLAPVPHRGKRNEPAYVAVTVEQLAQRRTTTPERLGAAAARNARSLFGLALPSPVG